MSWNLSAQAKWEGVKALARESGGQGFSTYFPCDLGQVTSLPVKGECKDSVMNTPGVLTGMTATF